MKLAEIQTVFEQRKESKHMIDTVTWVVVFNHIPAVQELWIWEMRWECKLQETRVQLNAYLFYLMEP